MKLLPIWIFYALALLVLIVPQLHAAWIKAKVRYRVSRSIRYNVHTLRVGIAGRPETIGPAEETRPIHLTLWQRLRFVMSLRVPDTE